MWNLERIRSKYPSIEPLSFRPRLLDDTEYRRFDNTYSPGKITENLKLMDSRPCKTSAFISSSTSSTPQLTSRTLGSRPSLVIACHFIKLSTLPRLVACWKMYSLLESLWATSVFLAHIEKTGPSPPGICFWSQLSSRASRWIDASSTLSVALQWSSQAFAQEQRRIF